MEFKEGNSVEVLREQIGPYGSWYPGSIIAVGDDYIIRYKFLMDNGRGELAVERVQEKNTRPQPPHIKERKRWVAGDVAEVFDTHCWRVGKVAKVLRNGRLVIKFFGFIQLKEFHVSSLRTHQVWHENKWSVIVKVRYHEQEANNSRHTTSNQCWSLVCSEPVEKLCEETCSKDQDEMRNLKKKSHAFGSQPESKNLILGERNKKRTSNHAAEGCKRSLIRNHSLFRQVGNSNFHQVGLDNNIKPEKETNFWLHSSVQPAEDSNQCSVASCSLNETSDFTSGSCHKLIEKISHSSDAESSSFPSLSSKRKTLLPSFGRKLEVDIHNLELKAYKSTVLALYASGPLSWEQESMLTNLRLSLHISNDEHLLQLRHLLAAQVL
ncbi:Agenet domain containing protein [Trema orientale]|uniref:Agenet domain containing protein n=1 Tax=Trema orientale TaxID=63057 RepID=A0A2P5FB38_TREOI|nr:Agenet domain containing protein [Trema orientale]